MAGTDASLVAGTALHVSVATKLYEVETTVLVMN